MFLRMTEFRWRPVFAPDGGGGGEGEPGAGTETAWTDGLAADHMDAVGRYGWKGPADAISAVLGAEKKLGAPASELVRLPGANATDEDHANFHASIGRPAKAEDYSFPVLEKVKADEKIDAAVREEAFRLGMTPRQANALREGQYAKLQIANQAFDQRINEGIGKVETALKAKHGDKFDAVKEFMDRGIQWLSGKDQALQDALEDSGLSGNLEAAERLISIGQAISEDGRLLGGSGRGFGGQIDTPDAAKEEINRLEGDKDFQAKLQNKRHPEHDAAVQERQKLYELAYGPAQAA